MADLFKDNPIFFIVLEQADSVSNIIDRCTIHERLGFGHEAIACDHARTLAAGDNMTCVYVLAWTLGQGIVVVAEYKYGAIQPGFAFHMRDMARYFAPLIVPQVAEYLDTAMRALEPVPADAGPYVA